MDKKNQKKKVLFILHVPPPVHGSSMVGELIIKSNLINNVLNSRYINLGTSKTIDDIGKNDIKKYFIYFRILATVFIQLIGFNPDLVYLAMTAKGVGFYKDFPIALLAKLFRKKLVIHQHSKGVNKNQHKPFNNLLYHTIYKNTKVILLSKQLYNDVSKYVKKDNIFFCPNGIPVINFRDNILSNNNNVTKILFLSNLIESKGVYVLLDSLKILSDNNVKFYCDIVGGEGDISLNQLNQKINNLNLQDYVSYVGKKYNDDKHKIFQSSDIFVFPTFYHNECFPLVLLEAMMFGLPVISTNEGGIPDIVKDSETGFIVQKQNPKQLSEKIKYLIDNPNCAILMGKKGQEMFFKHYTLEIFEKTLTHILN